MLVPTVIEDDGRKTISYDLFSRMLQDRIVILSDDVNPVSAKLIWTQMLYLDSVNNDPIQFFINSPGGHVTQGMAIYDVMEFIKSPVHTFALGQACSMGSFLLSCGEKGHRYVLPNAEIMIHQPSGGSRGQATDMEIQWHEMQKTKFKLTSILAKNTGKTYEQVLADCERDKWLTAKEAVDYGLADAIIFKKP